MLGDVKLQFVNSDRVDVTLATQLTVDRLSVLERMLLNWPGPASVALHVRDSELAAATEHIRTSLAFRRRSNVDVHIVYRRLVSYSSSSSSSSSIVVRFVIEKR